jgi:ribosome-binding factor A
MPTIRQLRINKQLQRDLADVIHEQGMAHYGGAMVTVSDVDVSPDLAHAKVYISIFPPEKTDAVLKTISTRTALATRTRNQLRIVPENSFLINHLPADYVDVCKRTVPAKSNLTPDNILVNIWTVQSGWVDFLFRLRNILVKPFGLESGNKDKFNRNLAAAIRSGESFEMVNMLHKTDNETIMQLKDKHLTAELSIYVESVTDNRKNISAITMVHFHNKLGIVYFFVIRPFHKIIVKTLLNKSIKDISRR